jgi:hypothetical protein
MSYFRLFPIRKAKPVEKLEAAYRTFLRRSSKKREQSEVCYLNDHRLVLKPTSLVNRFMFFSCNRIMQQMIVRLPVALALT